MFEFSSYAQKIILLQKIDQNEVLACLINGVKSGEPYPESLRRFCFALSYKDSGAYEIVRKQFNNNLPHLKTIKTWLALSDVGGEPGITQETLNRLKKHVDGLNGEKLICALMFDEMYIFKQVYFDSNKMDYVGTITYPTYEIDADGNEKKFEKMPIARKSIIFMLSGLNKHFEFPVLYHFVDSMKTKHLSELINEVIFKVSECGVKISNLTFDADRLNLAAVKMLGAHLNVFDVNFAPFINNPFDGSRILLFLDPSHMEKLFRNLLGNKEVIFDEHGNKIEWRYFVNLQNLSKDGKMLTHRLSRKHIDYQQNKMNVRLAVESFSSSVGDSMTILREHNHPEFKDSEDTSNFVYMMDKAWDILNSRGSRHSNIFKRALSKGNEAKIFAFIDTFIPFIKGLQININNTKKKVLDTRNFSPILGFIMDFTNLKLMYQEYVEHGAMKEISTYCISQDHLEMFHGKLRSRNGHNNNPTVMQFKGAYRRLLCNLDISPPKWSNCMILDSKSTDFGPQSNVYFISSRRSKLDVLKDDQFQTNLRNQEDEIVEDLCHLESLESSSHLLDGFASASIAYAARIIEKRIESREFYCDCCRRVFKDNDKIIDVSIHIVDTKRPCASTFHICKIVDRIMGLYKPKCIQNYDDRDFRVLYYLAFQEIDFLSLFTYSDFKDHEEHKFHLVKCIVQQYISIKTTQICKQITFDLHEKNSTN